MSHVLNVKIIEASNHTGLGSKSVGATWDADSGEMEIPEGSESVLLISDTDTYIIINSLTADPATDGFFMPKYTPTKLGCRGCTKIHYKRVTADGTLYVSAIGT